MTLLPESPSPAPVAKDVGVREFAQDVLKSSLEQPVLVDFWAPWCGPCKQLTPVLEKAVAATKGKVKLVKVNIDENQQLAGQMGIQSIPAVFAFYKGQPVDGFMGAQPESTIKAFIDKLIKISGGGAAGAAEAEVLAQANTALESGDLETANTLFADLLTDNPTHAGAYAGLVKVALAVGQSDEAQAMLDEAPPEVAKSKELDGVRAQLALAAQAQSAGPVDDLRKAVDAAPADNAKRYDLAVALHAAGQSEEAIDQLLEIIKREKGWNDDAARKQLVTVFEALGLMHELTIAGRRKLSAILFK